MGLVQTLIRTSRRTIARGMTRLPGSSVHVGPPRRVTTTDRWCARHPDQGRLHELSPERSTARRRPEHADPAAAELFERCLSGSVKRRFVADLESARSCGIGYGCCVTPDDAVLSDLSPGVVNFGTPRMPNGFHEAQDRLWLPRLQPLAGTTAAIHTFGHVNYHHWLLDTVPAFGLLAEAGCELGRFDHVLLQSPLAAFHRETLERLRIDPSRVIVQGASDHFVCDRALVPSYSEPGREPERFDYTPEGLRFVRELFEAGRVPPPVQAARLIVSRARASTRRLVNGADVAAALASAGFVNLHLEDFTIREQAALFAHADTVVMPTGGALANIVFCRPGTRVIELFSPAYLPMFSFVLCSALNLRYVALVGDGSERLAHSDEGSLKEIRITVERIREFALN